MQRERKVKEEKKQKSTLANTHTKKKTKSERTIGDAKRGERGRRKEEYKHKRKKN